MKLKTSEGRSFSAGGVTLIMVIIMISCLLGMFYFFWQNGQLGSADKTYISRLGEQKVLSQELAKLASQAARGRLKSFPELQVARNKFQQILNYQNNVTSQLSAVKSLDSTWKKYSTNIDTILQRREVVTSMRSYINSINEQIPTLLAMSDEVVSTMTEQGAPSDQVYIATRQLMLIQRISSNVSRVLDGGEGAVTAADRFGRDAALFGSVIHSMLNGNPAKRIQRLKSAAARAKLQLVQKQFNQIKTQVGSILDRSPEMFQVSGAAEEILGSSDAILKQIEKVESSYEGLISSRMTLMYAFALGGVAILFIVGIVVLYFLAQRRALFTTDEQRRVTEETNKRNQEAILRLLDEMGDLADGDLTVQATVTEDITGAIADSINYAIDALRNLVQAINETTQQVSSAAQQSQATAMHLAEASDHQAQQITAASSAINEMAVSIDAVSNHAAELAGEANRSVDIAVRGNEAVQRTIHGMDSIREQIQETSKRIKRLGESSQEIGDIVELINDIAEQTNILALNAAIQAAMAGEAGRGFAVVADEVQRLAERSADATKQIEALVKGIQSDTKEAVSSMEQSTAGVVQGAQLAQNAGQSLEAIENVSKHLADLIRNISDSARQQASAANNISDTMNVIQEITTQTSAGTNETAASIGNLAELANELRRSVAGFKLPL
ncbi:MAG: methyl-accepting chemotaxis protein [Gammaproteobacteria bacterium]